MTPPSPAPVRLYSNAVLRKMSYNSAGGIAFESWSRTGGLHEHEFRGTVYR
jgi:hypothetical protein